MTLADYRADAMRCTRCSYCKWIPFDLVKSSLRQGLPRVKAGKFHAYSAGGRLVTALSLMDGRSEVTDTVVRHRLRVSALRQLRRGLQAVPLRHGADPALHELRAHLVEIDPRAGSYRALIGADRALAGRG